MKKTNNMYKILVVDDEEHILEILQYNLRKNGYEVFLAQDGRQAVKKAKKIIPDLIILDYMMPLVNGIDACKQIKSLPELEHTRIVFLTARADDGSEIECLRAGADDYITKPIRPNVLVAKLESILRRYSNKQEQVFHFEDVSYENLQIFVDRHLVIFDNKEIFLPKKEFKLLALLASNPHKVFTRQEIFTYVWGNDIVVGNRTIDVHIRKLREKLQNMFIKTVTGVGYIFYK